MFWGRVEIFGGAKWELNSGCGGPFPILFLKGLLIVGAFIGIVLRDDILTSAHNPDPSVLTKAPQVK